jgi:hypothetical protein
MAPLVSQVLAQNGREWHAGLDQPQRDLVTPHTNDAATNRDLRCVPGAEPPAHLAARAWGEGAAEPKTALRTIQHLTDPVTEDQARPLVGGVGDAEMLPVFRHNHLVL